MVLLEKTEKGEELEEKDFRIMVMNSIRKNVGKFKGDYGRDVIIACDTTHAKGHSWRKDYFPYYKAKRTKDKMESALDWPTFFKHFNTIKDEIKEHTNYKVIDVESAEADDIISHFAFKHGVFMGEGDEKIVIISADKDFLQLQKFSNIKQYDPIRDRFLTTPNPHLYLLEHIIRGDRGDGVPNVLSPDDNFVSGKRAVTLTKKRFDALFESARDGTIETPGYFRNRVLIDLVHTPQSIHDKIHQIYEEESNKGKKSIMSYLTKYRMPSLIDSLKDF